MRASEDIEQAVEVHGATVWRVCVLHFGQGPDAQDAFQDTFVKYTLADTQFDGDEHRKAWLIRVATNVCKDMHKAVHRRNVPLEDAPGLEPAAASDAAAQPASATSDVVDALRTLTDPPRTPVFLSLYFGYTASEIGQMLDAPVGTVYSWIARGKKQLKEALA